MNRRSFLRRLAGVFAAPLAAIPVAKAEIVSAMNQFSYNYTTFSPEGQVDRVALYKTDGNGNILGKPVECTIGEYSDYISMQWDCGDGYLDIPGSKKMGPFRKLL
jgi:hypothetical protein